MHVTFHLFQYLPLAHIKLAYHRSHTLVGYRRILYFMYVDDRYV